MNDRVTPDEYMMMYLELTDEQKVEYWNRIRAVVSLEDYITLLTHLRVLDYMAGGRMEALKRSMGIVMYEEFNKEG